MPVNELRRQSSYEDLIQLYMNILSANEGG